MIDHEQLAARIEAALERVQGYGRAPLPWEVNSGCSYRRIGTKPTPENGYFRNSGDNVLCAVRQRSDGHLDLSMSEDHLEALCEIVNSVPELIAALRARSQNDG